MRAEFRPVLREADLPATGTRESEILDFKQFAPIARGAEGDSERWEVAKDLAALSNANGGTIIYGAWEQGSALESYVPIVAAADADRHRDQIIEVASNGKWCVPRFTVDVRRLQVNGGSIVVANVFPAPGQAIAVRVARTLPPVPDVGKNVDTYCYPVRVGDKSQWLDPEQAARLMIPQLRRVVSLLKRIEREETIRSVTTGYSGKLLEVNEDLNFVRLSLTNNPGRTPESPIIYSLEQITSVWFHKPSREWRFTTVPGVSGG